MHGSPFLSRLLVCLGAGFLIVASMAALADPPTRAARLSFVSGSASFSPSGSDEWVQARINRPMWIGDRVWSGDGRVELQLGGASLRLAPQTLLQILNFDDRIAQFEVTQGSVALHVRAIDRDDVIEIDTPSFAFVTRQQGDYRIDVERDHTAVSTRRGNADIYGQDVAYRIDRRERFAFYSADLRDYDAGPLPPADSFDRWSRERAQREDRSTSARYVAPELVGFVDLDSYGEWRTEPALGNVWIPRVAADWAPYRYGHWSWIDPWGWTWVDDAPWGFAPSHYGRWTQIGRSWAWVPGPRDVRPAYSPAMVAWVGGDSFSLTVSSGTARGVGWFPLAPGEVWRPSYEVSRDYFTRVNVANTVVNNTTIVNVYNNRNDVRISNADYRFRATRAAVTAVPVDTFVQGRPVQLTQAQMNANAAAQANVLPSAPARPVRQSLVGPAPRAQARPPAEIVQRQVVARSAPPATMPSLDQRAALVREGTPITRESLERGNAPSAVQRPATPEQPSGPATAKPAPREVAPTPAAVPAAVPQRPNVRVVDAEKAAPKPLPEGGTRASRADEDRARGKGATQAAPRAGPDPAQTARPERESTPPPPQPPARQATPSTPAPAPAPAPQAAPSRAPDPMPSAPPAARSGPGRTPETAVVPPRGDAPTTRPAPASAGSPPAPDAPPPPRANGQPGGRGAPPAAPSSAPARERAPEAAPPATAPRGTPPDEAAKGRRESPTEAPPPRPSAAPSPPAAAPASPPQTTATPATRPSSSVPSQRGGAETPERARSPDSAPRPGGQPDDRRAPPAQGAAVPPSLPAPRGDAPASRPGSAPAQPPAAAKPAAAPAQAPAAQSPDAAGRSERGKDKDRDDKEMEKDKDKDKDKDKEKDKEKGKG